MTNQAWKWIAKYLPYWSAKGVLRNYHWVWGVPEQSICCMPSPEHYFPYHVRVFFPLSWIQGEGRYFPMLPTFTFIFECPSSIYGWILCNVKLHKKYWLYFVFSPHDFIQQYPLPEWLLKIITLPPINCLPPSIISYHSVMPCGKRGRHIDL